MRDWRFWLMSLCCMINIALSIGDYLRGYFGPGWWCSLIMIGWCGLVAAVLYVLDSKESQ